MEDKALINIGELSKPATVLIEKISEAIGGIYRPYQLRRMAQAEADAEQIKAVSKIEVTDLQRRAMHRFFEEEGKKQQNIENITSKALPDVKENSFPEKIENDWLTNFFDKCRLISDEEMQLLWAKVLAGEANTPNSFSKRTINLLSSLDKKDALMFQGLCRFGWFIKDEIIPLVFDEDDEIYSKHGINFSALKHLNEIGLVTREPLAGFTIGVVKDKCSAFYYETQIRIQFKEEKDNSLPLGILLLSKAGLELAKICGATPIEGFTKYVAKKWEEQGLKVTFIESISKAP